jgi:pimeloyl-ACP methyl ester carboxylesterase
MRSITTPTFALLLSLLCPLGLGCKIEVGEGDRHWHALVDPHRKFESMAGYRLHYIDMGEGDPVVMVHGFADSTYSWHKNLRGLLSEHFRVILVDQPGLGFSDLPPSSHTYTVENQAKEILRLLDRLHIDHFNLVGHSMGGGIVLYLSQKFPERINKTIVIDPASFKIPLSYLGPLASIPGMDHLVSLLACRWLVGFALKMVYYNDHEVTDIRIDEYARHLNRPGSCKVLSALFRQYFSDALTRMSRGYEDMTVPLLIIWGEKDCWIPVEYGVRLHRQVPKSLFYRMPKCGHNAHQECDEEVNRLMVDFLKH